MTALAALYFAVAAFVAWAAGSHQVIAGKREPWHWARWAVRGLAWPLDLGRSHA